MSFTVQKSLGNSYFRFAVGRRRELRSIDQDKDLSTGPSGEFIRHRPEIFYAADVRQIHKPEVPQLRLVSGTPFWSMLFDGTGRGWAMLGVMIFGGLIAFLGIANVLNENRAGWALVFFGLAIAAIPIVITANKRRSIRSLEDRKRKEREERDKRNAELLATYLTSLDSLREKPDDESLTRVMRENEKLDLPYAVWADAAIGTVLYVGLSTLAKVGP